MAEERKSRGLAVIVTNDYVGYHKLTDLRNTHYDGSKMEKVFNELKFVTHWEKNVTTTQHQQIIDGIIESDHPRCNGYYKCIAYVFSGHGGEEGALCLQDGGTVYLNDIIEKLCKRQLADIPKVFFIDACRQGRVQKADTGIPYNVSVSPLPSPVPLRSRRRSQLRRIIRYLRPRIRRKRDTTVVHEAKPIGHSDIGTVDPTLSTSVNPSLQFQEILSQLEGNFLIAYATIDKQSSYMKNEGSAWMIILADELTESGISVQDATAKAREKLVDGYRNE